MPVVKNPFLSTDARGSLFGLTASFVRGGNVVKKKARPSTKLEPRVSMMRSLLGWLSREWGGLTDAQRDSWDDWVVDHPGTDKFGDPFIMSGFNAFIMLNHHAVRMTGPEGGGAAMQVLPPEDPPASSCGSLWAGYDGSEVGQVELAWTELGTGVATDFWEIQMAGPFQSEGRKSVTARYRFVAKVAGDVMMYTVPDLDVGMWYWFRVRYVDEFGQVTAWVPAHGTPKSEV